MKVLHVITGLNLGGAERALYNLLAGGLARRFDTAVLSLRDEGEIGPRIRDLGVPLHALGMRRGLPGPAAIARLSRVVRSFQPNLLQGWMYHGNLAATLAARLAPGRPALAWNIRQTLYDLQAEKFLTRQVIRANGALSARADAVIYNSRLSRSQHEAPGFAASRGRVVPNGFDLERLHPDLETGNAVRRELSLSRDSPVVGHVARFHPMKDHASFLHAAVRVARELPAARFLLVGREVSLDNPAMAGIVPPELEDRFVFAGERSDVERLMQAMDVLATSSAWGEAFPNVLGEAMAIGVPCVATDVGDSANIVADTGIIVPPSDTEALASGLLKMVQKTSQARKELGQLAREHVKTHYGLDSVVAQYADLYMALQAKR